MVRKGRGESKSCARERAERELQTHSPLHHQLASLPTPRLRAARPTTRQTTRPPRLILLVLQPTAPARRHPLRQPPGLRSRPRLRLRPHPWLPPRRYRADSSPHRIQTPSNHSRRSLSPIRSCRCAPPSSSRPAEADGDAAHAVAPPPPPPLPSAVSRRAGAAPSDIHEARRRPQ